MCAPAPVPEGCTVNTSRLADPLVTSNGSLVAAARPVAVAADRVYPVPVDWVPIRSMVRVENVATPATAFTAVTPDSVAPPVPVPLVITTVTFPVKPGTVLPSASCTAGAIAAPASVALGCTANANWAGAPAVIANAALGASGRPSATAASVYPVPLLSMLSVEKLATPATAVTVVVPDSVPPPGLVPIVTVTAPTKSVAVRPTASRASTWTAGASVAPAVAAAGCITKASWVGGPGGPVVSALQVDMREERTTSPAAAANRAGRVR